jgi:predicted  nucleic acid-binding Zn-ribbon protein
LAEAQRLVAKRDQEIDQLRPALGEAEALASKRHDELKTMRERLIRLERESLLLEQRLAAIENSFAWRVIAPLRKFGPARGTRRG